MSKYVLKVEFPVDQFLDDLEDSIEGTLTEAKIAVTPKLREGLRKGLKEVVSHEMMFDATCGLSVVCKEAVLVEPFTPEAEKLQREEAALKKERHRVRR